MVSTAGAIVIAISVILLAAAIGWIVFTQLRARRLGLPPPTLSSYLPWHKSEERYGPPRPAPGGVIGWFNDQLRKFKNRGNRSATGAYEQPLHGGTSGGRRGFGPLDPDEAWDARVGAEADTYGYYEETELGPAPRGGSGGGSYQMNVPTGYGEDGADDERGRRAGRPGERNPFDDDAEASLRGVSPRPIDTSVQGTKQHGEADPDTSPTERRSVFRENV